MTSPNSYPVDPRLDLVFERVVDVPPERVWTAWTNVLGPGYRPTQRSTAHACDSFPFTAIISLEPRGRGTEYRALLVHGDEEGRRKHEQMGFHEGWGKALDQLVAMIRRT